ncbi:MAG: sensor N-terminal transmembrane domain-containing protein [Alphaproteobacteria bacterium]|nr:sensor N-terminal transmembrane domain-containing protein [Alphaproteobacteria bacterium]
MARIALINILGLVVLAMGILFFNQYRQSLINARVQSLMVQGQIIAAAIAGSATADTSAIEINPQSLGDQINPDGTESYGANLDFPISPETAGPVLRRLLANTTIRAQIIDPGGNLLVDSISLYGGNDIVENGFSKPETLTPLQAAWKFFAKPIDWLFSYDYPLHVDYGMDNNSSNPEVAAALNGATVSVVRLNINHEIIVLVSVPVQRFRAVLGALVLSTKGGEIDAVLSAERRVVILTFGFAALVALLLSALLAGTIAQPIRRLSAAAVRVRRGINKRVEIPDFTARKDEIGQLSGSLRDMTTALYQRIEAIEAFAADVSHELKNPLTSLRSAVETLSFVKTDEQRQRLIEIVVHDVKRMDRLITDISDASRLDAELARAEIHPVDLSKLLGSIVGLANETAKPEDAEILLVVQPVTDRHKLENKYAVLGNDGRLGQVFRNLIDNARSFTAAGTKISVRLRRVGADVEVRVEDSGPGIRPENLERVFERFYTDRPHQSFGRNSGLGLAISRQVVEAHKGRIYAENRLGKVEGEGEKPILGARFVVRVPALPEGWSPADHQ